MDKTTTSKETAIIELETLTPLFIKGKDPDYGEGTYLIGDKAYILDNDKLCKFIYDKTYDEDGNLRGQGKNYVEFYGDFLVRNENGNDLYLYNAFARRFGLNQVRENRSVPKGFKNRSAKFFLQETGLVVQDQSTEEGVVRDIAKGITYVSKAERGFIVDGCGNPYIPGSSIKGAIRNALLWAMLKENFLSKSDFQKFVQDRLAKTTNLNRDNKTEFAKEFCTPRNRGEHSLNAITSSRFEPTFKGEGNFDATYIKKYEDRWRSATEMQKDLFRIIKISDADFITSEEMVKLKIKTYKLQGNSFQPKDFLATLNGFPEKVKARFKITIDKALANEIFSGLMPDCLTSVPKLLKTTNSFFRAVAGEEQKFFSLALSTQDIVEVQDWYKPYRITDDRAIPESPLLFRLGWGGGMMTKTQFLHLLPQERTNVRNLIKDRRNTVAPQSRCLEVQRVNNYKNRNSEYKAVYPLGWCTLNYIGASKKALQTAPLLPDQVKAVVVDIKSNMAKVRVIEGKYTDTETVMRKTLECLLLRNGAEVLVDLVISNGKPEKAKFKKML